MVAQASWGLGWVGMAFGKSSVRESRLVLLASGLGWTRLVSPWKCTEVGVRVVQTFELTANDFAAAGNLSSCARTVCTGSTGCSLCPCLFLDLPSAQGMLVAP